MPDWLRNAPTKASLRELLGKVLPTAVLFDAFCVDHFPDVAVQRGDGMTRAAKENLLLEMEEPAEILRKLTESHPEALEQLAALVRAVDTAGATISADLLDRILAIVSDAAWPPDELAHAFYLSAPPEWRCDFDVDCRADLAQRMLMRLALAIGQSDGAHPVLRFALHLMRIVARSGVLDHARGLLAWFQEAAVYLGVSTVKQEQLQREVESAAHSDDHELYLVVVMTKAADPGYDRVVRAWKVIVPLGKDQWSIGDAEQIAGYEGYRCREVDLPKVIGDLYTALEGDLARVGDHRFTIELILPVELFALDVDRWCLDPTMAPLGASHHVVLRSWERAYGAARGPALPAARRKWAAKWKQLHGPCDRVAWTCSSEDAAGIGPKLHDGPACVALCFAPGCGGAGHVSVLRDLIYAGAPVAVWPRELPRDEARFRACVEDLATRARPALWHEAVKGYRTAAFKEQDAAHLGHHLAVLRDDPNKLLPDTRARLRAPAG